jgi:hypothetical protein
MVCRTADAREASSLGGAADNLRANPKLTSGDYFMPVLGVIFLCHAANRFDAQHRQIEAEARIFRAHQCAPPHASNATRRPSQKLD